MNMRRILSISITLFLAFDVVAKCPKSCSGEYKATDSEVTSTKKFSILLRESLSSTHCASRYTLYTSFSFDATNQHYLAFETALLKHLNLLKVNKNYPWVDPRLLLGKMMGESACDPTVKNSITGALGIFQFMGRINYIAPTTEESQGNATITWDTTTDSSVSEKIIKKHDELYNFIRDKNWEGLPSVVTTNPDRPIIVFYKKMLLQWLMQLYIRIPVYLGGVSCPWRSNRYGPGKSFVILGLGKGTYDNLIKNTNGKNDEKVKKYCSNGSTRPTPTWMCQSCDVAKPLSSQTTYKTSREDFFYLIPDFSKELKSICGFTEEKPVGVGLTEGEPSLD